MPFLKHWASDTGLEDAYHADPRIYSAIYALHEALMRGTSSLSIPQRELLATYVSALNRCKYCVVEHAHEASRTGVNAEVFRQVLADIETAPIRPKLKPLLRFARKLTVQPDQIMQRDVDALFEAGWDEKAYRDTVAVCALMSLANRLAAGFGIEAAGKKRVRKRVSAHRQRRSPRPMSGTEP